MATLLKADGSVEKIDDCSLTNLQKLVGGWIELVPYTHEHVFVVNEEGGLNSLPINRKASLMAGIRIVGDVIVCEREELD